MPHDEPDLVGMRLEHHTRCLGVIALEHRPHIAMGIAFDAISERLDVFDPKFLTFALPTGRAWRGEDFKEARGFHVQRFPYPGAHIKKEK